MFVKPQRTAVEPHKCERVLKHEGC